MIYCLQGNNIGGARVEETLVLAFTEYLEKQELLTKLSEQEFLHAYSYSEVHCIDAIEILQAPNVTNIASYLKMTRGGVSKMTKKQIEQGLIEKYQLVNNKKEVYFRLTKNGLKIYQEHKRRHNLYKQRDMVFFSHYPKEQLETIQKFMESYNDYLDLKMKEMEKK